VVRYLSGNPDIRLEGLKGLPYISLDSSGLPKILPIGLRVFLREKDLVSKGKIIGSILTLINIYRVFPTKVKPDLETIIAPFSGFSRTLDQALVERGVKDFIGSKKFSKYFKITLIGGESAGPNSFHAVWGAAMDVFAFIHNPKALLTISI
jgi:hypothetical protein